MANLIERLSDQHLELLRMSIDLPLATDPQARWEQFKAFEALANLHLQTEDLELYAPLKDKLLNFDASYRSHLALTQHAKEFFAWWPTPEALQGDGFETAFAHFMATLNERMKSEERGVFYEYMDLVH